MSDADSPTPTPAPDGTVACTDLGRMPYREAWRLQRDLVALRKAGVDRDRLLLVVHDAVITLGQRGSDDNVLADPADLASRRVEVLRVERGGDVTYHGPGQLVAYPVLDLRRHRRDVRWYARSLLEAIVRTVADFGIVATAREGAQTGVWVEDGRGAPAKLASLGVRIERWITYHGVALNVDPRLEDFGWIVPCGLPGVRVTSMARLLGRPVPMSDVRTSFVASFAAVFGVAVVDVPADRLQAAMRAARSDSEPP